MDVFSNPCLINKFTRRIKIFRVTGIVDKNRLFQFNIFERGFNINQNPRFSQQCEQQTMPIFN